jgi:hypothetical protein
MSGKQRRSPSHSPDIEFTASLQGDELRFGEPPETDVRFSGEPGHESESGSDRTHLPEKVEPGVTYRDVRIDYRLANRLNQPVHWPGERGRRPQRNE